MARSIRNHEKSGVTRDTGPFVLQFSASGKEGPHLRIYRPMNSESNTKRVQFIDSAAVKTLRVDDRGTVVLPAALVAPRLLLQPSDLSKAARPATGSRQSISYPWPTLTGSLHTCKSVPVHKRVDTLGCHLSGPAVHCRVKSINNRVPARSHPKYSVPTPYPSLNTLLQHTRIACVLMIGYTHTG